MQALIVFATSLVLLLASPIVALPAANLNAEFAVTTETPFGASVSITFPAPSFATCMLDNGQSGLMASMPNAVPDFDAGSLVLPVFTKLAAVPRGYRAEVVIRNQTEVNYSLDALVPRDGNLSRQVRSLEADLPMIETGDPVWIRWLRVAPVIIRPIRYDAVSQQLAVVQQIDLEITYVPDGTDNVVEQPDVKRYWSLAFDEFFRGMLLNPGSLPEIPQNGLEVTRGTYLIVTTDSLARHAQKIADWKRRKGFNVVIEAIAHDRSLSPDVVRDYIANAYHTWERPPEFVLLLGDVDRGHQYLPAYRISSFGGDLPDVTDLEFSTFEGDDYFPDVLVGRLAVDAVTETANVTKRLLRYEQDSTGASADRFHRATVFAGNFSDNGAEILTPVATSEWLERILRDRGWGVDTFYYRGKSYSPTKTIVESINRGVNLVSYRGWGNVTGTHNPPFYTDDLNALENGPLLPLMTFFVCNTADFGNNYYGQCFGDRAVTGGSAFIPTGAIAFVGPTDLHTETHVNNPMCGGYYAGIFFENQRNIGALLLRGKMEIWRSMPLYRDREENQSNAWFYFNIYTLLGDPELNYFLDPPTRLSVSAPQTLAIGSREAQFVVRDGSGHGIKGAVIHLAGRGVDYTILTDNRGVALVSPSLTQADTLQVTIVGQQLSPWFGKIPVIPAARMITVESYTIGAVANGSLPTGESSLTFRIKNLGASDETNVHVAVESMDDQCHLIDQAIDIANIQAGASLTSTPIHLAVESSTANAKAIPLRLQVSFGTAPNRITVEHTLRIPVSNAAFLLADIGTAAMFNPSEVAAILPSLTNVGTSIDGIVGELDSFDDAVEILQGTTRYGQIAHDATVRAQDSLRVRVRAGVTIGRQVQLRIILRNQTGQIVHSVRFPVTIGTPGARDPLGPDGYGYYAYENIDNNPNAPQYDWKELDPMFGGSGQVRVMDDEEIERIDLPFTFQFYGEDYHQITMCSNGWISFEDAAFPDFANQSLPSPLGPKGLIAPYWDDLVGERRDTWKDSLRVVVLYQQNEGRFTVEWSRVMARSAIGPMRQTFEVSLFDPAVRQTPTGDGEILFQYQEARLVSRENDLNYATIGIENWAHNKGLEISYSNLHSAAIDTLIGGRAIRITTVPPDTFLSANNDPVSILPTKLRLDAPSPNPFNQQTNIQFGLPTAGRVRLSVVDMCGREVRVLVDETKSAGDWTVTLQAGSLTSGVYLIKLESAGNSQLAKAVLLR